MRYMRRNHLQFEEFPSARYETDFTLQKANLPSVNFKKVNYTIPGSINYTGTKKRSPFFQMGRSLWKERTAMVLLLI